MPRFGGPATMFRLPSSELSIDLDIGIIGIPLDIGASNRSGTRYGPCDIRAESVLVRPYGMHTKAAPFDSFQVADIGDVGINTFNLADSINIIERHYCIGKNWITLFISFTCKYQKSNDRLWH